MKPDRVMGYLRQIADGIENSKRPDQNLVMEDIKRILAALSDTPQKIYRIITDAPIGVAVGFVPSKESLDKLNAETDEWNLVDDDGSYGSVLLVGDPKTNNVMIRDGYPIQDELNMGMISPLGPDLEIFRSQQEFDEYVNDWYE